MQSKASEVLMKIKELRNLTSETEKRLEKDGLSITSIPKEQLFNYNIRSMISAVESILRNEPAEKPTLRLEKDIPDAYSNLKKIRETQPGKMHSTALDKIEELIRYIEQNYKRW